MKAFGLDPQGGLSRALARLAVRFMAARAQHLARAGV